MGLFGRFKKDKADYSEKLKQFAKDYKDAINSPASPDTLNNHNIIFEGWMEFTQSNDINDPNFYYANVVQMIGVEGMIEESETCLELADKLDYYENSDPELNKWFKDFAYEVFSRKKSNMNITKEDFDNAVDYGKRFKECFENQKYDQLGDIITEWRDNCPFDPNLYYAFAIFQPFDSDFVKMMVEQGDKIKPEYIGEDIFLNKWYKDGAHKITGIVDSFDGKKHVVLK